MTSTSLELQQQRSAATRRLKLVRAALATTESDHDRLLRDLALSAHGALDEVSSERNRRRAAVSELLEAFGAALISTGQAPPPRTAAALLAAAAALPTTPAAAPPEMAPAPTLAKKGFRARQPARIAIPDASDRATLATLSEDLAHLGQPHRELTPREALWRELPLSAKSIGQVSIESYSSC